MAPHLENETALLDQARIGNAEAFAALLKRCDRNISQLALCITGNREDADDALQEALLKAYLNVSLFRGDARFYTWLVRIAVNEALTMLRKQAARRQVSLDDETASHELADWADNPEQRYARTERQEIVNEALQVLHPSLRVVLTLHYLKDFSSREIARQLRLSVPAVKSRLMRARTKLRQRLGQDFGRSVSQPGWRKGREWVSAN